MLPYDNSITAIATAAGEAFGFFDKLSPAFVALITENIALNKPLKEQRILDRRIRKCQRFCRIHRFTRSMILNQVAIDFSMDGDTDNMRTEIYKQLVFELLKIDLH